MIGIMYLLFPMIVQDYVPPLIFATLFAKHQLLRPHTLTVLLNYGTMFVGKHPQPVFPRLLPFNFLFAN